MVCASPFSKLIKFILETSSRDLLIKEPQSLPSFLIKESGMASKAFSSAFAFKNMKKTGIVEGWAQNAAAWGDKEMGQSENHQDSDSPI